MRLRDTLDTSLTALTLNKTRAMLTMLGIVIGVASVVLMVSMGKSFQSYIVNLINTIGTNTMDIFPSALERNAGDMKTLTYEDYLALRQLSTVENITPVIIVPKSVKYGREEVSPLIIGAHGIIISNYGLTLASGRLLEAEDEDGAKSVAVVAAKTATDLFGDRNPIGKTITIGSASFKIIGVLKSQGSALLANLDTPVFIPFSTSKALTGQSYLTYITLKTVGEPAIAKEDITLLLRQRHRIDNPANDSDKDDFIARSAEQVSSILHSVTLGLTVFLSLVAGISLLVGGIGIMNIMLVSVTERTREIGLRKAVGASRRDILLQFLFEAVALTFTGGAVGILLGVFAGWFLSLVANKFLGDFTFILSVPSLLLAAGMAVSIGLLFGIYPARRASMLSPMEALRFE